MQMYSPGAHDPPGAAHGMQFRFSAFLVEAVSMCYSTEGKKDWTSLAEFGTKLYSRLQRLLFIQGTLCQLSTNPSHMVEQKQEICFLSSPHFI